MNAISSIVQPRIRAVLSFSPRAYVRSVFGDARSALARVVRDRAALAAILLFLLPWWALVFLRDKPDWLFSFGEMLVVAFLFWWMSRSGRAPLAEVKRPAIESILAIALVFLWVEWRAGICDKTFPFLPADFGCFGSWEFEIIPKLIVTVLIPFAVMRGMGYGFRAQGANLLNGRAWWITLPVLLAALAFGLLLHYEKLPEFVGRLGTYFAAAGLPEEYLFRAFLLTRLEAWWRSPGWALFGSSAIFGLSHLAIDYLVFTNRNWPETWITLLTFQMGFGFIFGFAYQRTGNLWPIALVHAFVDAL